MDVYIESENFISYSVLGVLFCRNIYAMLKERKTVLSKTNEKKKLN